MSQSVMSLVEFDGLNPDPEHENPRVWVEELQVYRAFNPEMLQKEYRLQRGLNILWSDPGEGRAELYADGLSGHAAGKTTFCRLLRYLLGEPVPGRETFRQRLVGWEPNSVLIGKVWLNGVSWIVCRPLGMDHRDFAVQSEQIDSIFSAVLGTIEYSEFFEKLEAVGLNDLQGSTLPFGGAALNWRRLLPWLSRDQDCRFGKLSAWRDSVSESQTPETTLTDACYIIRRTVGLISEPEETLQAEHRKTVNKRKKLEQDLPLQKYRLKQDELRLSAWDDSLLSTGEGLFLSKLEAALKVKLDDEKYSDELSGLKQIANNAQLVEKTIQKELNFAQARHEELIELLETDKTKLASLKGETEKKNARQDMDANAPAKSSRCNVPLWIAEREGCSLAQGMIPDFESNKNVLQLDERFALFEEQVCKMKTDIAASSASLRLMNNNLEKAHLKYQNAWNACSKLKAQEDQAKGEMRHQLAEIESFKVAQRKADVDEANFELLKKAERTSKDELAAHRKKSNAHKMRVNDLFEDIVRAVLGQQVSASFAAHSDHIDLNIDYHGSRESSATDTVQIIAFDLAALLLSAENRGSHPGLLIHDSPREADMARDIYHRFFLYMEKMQALFPDCLPSYQYIVTTTEPPPEALQEKPWLIEKLDASTPKGRLLGVDL